MKSIAGFAKTTLVGGLLVILPVYLAVLLLAKGFKAIIGLLAPVTAQIPASVELREALAILIVVGLCFVTGLIVRTGPGLRMVNAFQQAVLERIPGYHTLRSVIQRISGQAEEITFQPALVQMDEGLAPAFIIEALDDGRFVVLFPSVPTPAAGNLLIVEASRVKLADLPFTKAFSIIGRWGTGTHLFVDAKPVPLHDGKGTVPGALPK